MPCTPGLMWMRSTFTNRWMNDSTSSAPDCALGALLVPYLGLSCSVPSTSSMMRRHTNELAITKCMRRIERGDCAQRTYSRDWNWSVRRSTTQDLLML
ncbi:hypothetical protein IE81DRAFT_92338 [Ceraceosorus guamensis]|uniref:Uncharacterized protein n=1 Tax=Ceraceosorus guamensis TaxID=1522189 RepID=A0A316VQK0_9BASI|nr:hypothetical protein IE81DRAFT_92338 [Ceraceosorus guamensis]PWN38703.1 hypothetical protein IE81DRAFT_92338 [Ceraceosorus guamensis]